MTVTFDNFFEELKLHCLGQPKKAEGLGVIVHGVDHPLAKVWIDYCLDKAAEGDKRWERRAEFFAKMLRANNSLTMPCSNPRDFDRLYHPVQRPRPKTTHFTSLTPEARRAVIEQAMRGIVRGVRPYDPRRKDNPVEQPQSELDKLRDMYRAQKASGDVPALSPELADKLGLSSDREEGAA
jgi:hypothetical protein